MGDAIPSAELIQRYFDHVAPIGEIETLDELVSRDPCVADELAAAALFNEQLRDVFNRQLVIDNVEDNTRHRYKSEPALAPRCSRAARRSAFVGVCIVALVALLITSFVLREARDSDNYPHQLVSGRAAVDGVEQTGFADGDVLQVIGTRPAVVRLGDGWRVEMASNGQAVIRTANVELLRGSGLFQAHEAESPLLVTTAAGQVRGSGNEFSVEIMERSDESSTASPASLSMLVSVLTGVVDVEYEEETHELAAGDQRVFTFNKRDVAVEPDIVGRVV